MERDYSSLVSEINVAANKNAIALRIRNGILQLSPVHDKSDVILEIVQVDSTYRICRGMSVLTGGFSFGRKTSPGWIIRFMEAYRDKAEAYRDKARAKKLELKSRRAQEKADARKKAKKANLIIEREKQKRLRRLQRQKGGPKVSIVQGGAPGLGKRS